MTTSRREFFKTAAMGAVGAGAAFGTVAAEAKAAAPSKYDIIILGAGCGGLTCAVRAAENGLKPLLLEKMAMPAGNRFMLRASSLASTPPSRRPRMFRAIPPNSSSRTG